MAGHKSCHAIRGVYISELPNQPSDMGLGTRLGNSYVYRVGHADTMSPMQGVNQEITWGLAEMGWPQNLENND